MKQKVFEAKVKVIFLCIRNSRSRTPLAVVQDYLGSAKRSLKLAKRLKTNKRAVKDVKRDIQVAKLIISELKKSDDLQEIEKRLIQQRFECHVCEKTFTETGMKVNIMHVGKADTESRYNLCNACYEKRHDISELDTVYFSCVNCGNILPHNVLEKTDNGWQCQEPYGPCWEDLRR
ncbi:MAG: hypothetical protein OXH00_02830 [Candidatus Poribacteria bacterium]|nr:hypothetical protein [Candidatus Poribacteria bacterium]